MKKISSSSLEKNQEIPFGVKYQRETGRWIDNLFSKYSLSQDNIFFFTLAFNNPLSEFSGNKIKDRSSYAKKILRKFDLELNKFLVGDRFYKRNPFTQRAFYVVCLEKHTMYGKGKYGNGLEDGLNLNIPRIYKPTCPHYHGVMKVPQEVRKDWFIHNILFILRRTWSYTWFSGSADIQPLTASEDLQAVSWYMSKQLNWHVKESKATDDVLFSSLNFVNDNVLSKYQRYL